jgi:hypothetical protein
MNPAAFLLLGPQDLGEGPAGKNACSLTVRNFLIKLDSAPIHRISRRVFRQDNRITTDFLDANFPKDTGKQTSGNNTGAFAD